MKLSATFLWSVVAFVAVTFAAVPVVIWQGAGVGGGNLQGFAVWTAIMAGAVGFVMTGYARLTVRWFAVFAQIVALIVGAVVAEFGTYVAWLMLGTWLNAAGVPPIFCWVPAGACAGMVATVWWRWRGRKTAAAPAVSAGNAGLLAPRRLLPIVLSALATVAVGLLGWQAHERIIAQWTEDFKVLRPVPEAPMAGPLQQMYEEARYQIATSRDRKQLDAAEALLHAFAQGDPPAESLSRVASSFIFELNRLDRAAAVAWVDRMLASPYPGIATAARSWKRNWTAGDSPVDLKFTALDGREVDLARLLGKVVLLDFWATWCGPCIRELPNVKEVYAGYHNQGFEVIGISLDHARAREAVVKFVKVAKLPWPQYYDGKGWANQWASAFAINSIPAAWLLDQNGRVVDKNARGEQLESEVKRLLAR
jgi:thiol-disulfide isomerase/thioredoxin